MLKSKILLTLIISIAFYVVDIFIASIIFYVIYWAIILYAISIVSYLIAIKRIYGGSLSVKICLLLISIYFMMLISDYFLSYSLVLTDVLVFYLSKFTLWSILILILSMIINGISSKANLAARLIAIYATSIFVVVFFFIISRYVPWFHIKYYPNGEKRELMMLDITGSPDGEYKKWSKSGVLQVSGYYHNGYQSGKWQQFNDVGKLVKQIDKDTILNKVKYTYN